MTDEEWNKHCSDGYFYFVKWGYKPFDMTDYGYPSFTRLPPTEEMVLALFYGTGKRPSHSGHAIGRFIGLSAGRIHQIRHKALRMLRHPSRYESMRRFQPFAELWTQFWGLDEEE